MKNIKGQKQEKEGNVVFHCHEEGNKMKSLARQNLLRARLWVHYAAVFFSAARFLRGLGRLLPFDPRRILPRLVLKSPLPMSGGALFL